MGFCKKYDTVLKLQIVFCNNEHLDASNHKNSYNKYYDT